MCKIVPFYDYSRYEAHSSPHSQTANLISSFDKLIGSNLLSEIHEGLGAESSCSSCRLRSPASCLGGEGPTSNKQNRETLIYSVQLQNLAVDGRFDGVSTVTQNK